MGCCLLPCHREANLAADMRALLGEAPCLPLPGAILFLEDLVASGGDWATAALGAAREAIRERPPVREAMLHLVLQASVGEKSRLRMHVDGAHAWCNGAMTGVVMR